MATKLSVFSKPNSAAPVTASAPSDLIFCFILRKSVFEASRGLMEVVVAVVVRREGKCQTREEGFGESELETTLQRSATLTVAADRARSYSVPQILTIKSL